MIPRYADKGNPPAEGYQRCICGQWAISYHRDCLALMCVTRAPEKVFDEDDTEFDLIGWSLI